MTLSLLAVEIWSVICFFWEAGNMIGDVEIGKALYLLIFCLGGVVILAIHWEWCLKIIHRKKEERENLKNQVSRGRGICQTIIDPNVGL